MANLIKPVSYEVYNQKVPFDGDVPVAEVNEWSTIEGSIVVSVATLTDINTLTADVFRVVPPSGTETRWSKVLPALYSPEVLYFSSEVLRDGRVKITWRLDPSSIATVAHGYYYGIQFYLNEVEDASVS